MNGFRQNGSALIIVLVVVMLLTIIGVMAVRSGLLGLNIATNSQASHIMDQNNDAALFQIEDNAQFDDFIAGTGLFGYPKMIANRDKELVICYRGKINQFYQFYRASVVYTEKNQDQATVVKTEDIGGSARSGFCQVNDQKSDFVSGRAAAMTQISVRVAGSATDGDEPFSYYQVGTDTESGKLDEAVRLIVTATTVMPVLSTEDNETINACMKNLSYVDTATNLETISECLSKNAVPYKTQVSEYTLGQFIKKVV